MRRRIGDGLDYIARTNSAMLMTGDMALAIQANLAKSKVEFPKLWYMSGDINVGRVAISMNLQFSEIFMRWPSKSAFYRVHFFEKSGKLTAERK